jgi:predicted acylesterase/phospholipase RssA
MNTASSLSASSLSYDTLVLPAGSFLGFSVLGSIDYAIENRLLALADITTIVGTSVGTIAGCLLCIGLSPIDILIALCQDADVFSKLQNISLFNLIENTGMVSFDPVQCSIEAIILKKIQFIPTLGDLKTIFNKNLIACAYSLTDGDEYFFSSLTHPDVSVMEVIRASCSVPLLFNVHSMIDKLCIDGGLRNEFPLNVVLQNDANAGDRTIYAIYLHAPPVTFRADQLADLTSSQLFMTSLRVAFNSKSKFIFELYSKTKTSKRITIIPLQIDISNTIGTLIKSNGAVFDTPWKLNLFGDGYRQTEKYFKKIN